MKFANCLIFIALAISPALSLLTQQAMDNLTQQQNHCAWLSGVTKDHLKMAQLNQRIYEDKRQERFAVCMLKKFNIMNVDGSINRDENSYALVTDNPASFQAALNCAALAGTNVREAARKIMTCLMHTDIYVMDPWSI